MNVINYTTRAGETLSQIAYKMYGSLSGISTIIRANPMQPVETIFPAGVNLIIPILDDNDTTLTTTTNNLPPWKR